MSQPQKLKQLVVAEFSSPAVVEKYAKEATQELWASEEILIDEYFKSGSSILDLGCGTGRTTLLPLPKSLPPNRGKQLTTKRVMRLIYILTKHLLTTFCFPSTAGQ